MDEHCQPENEIPQCVFSLVGGAVRKRLMVHGHRWSFGSMSSPRASSFDSVQGLQNVRFRGFRNNSTVDYGTTCYSGWIVGLQLAGVLSSNTLQDFLSESLSLLRMEPV